MAKDRHATAGWRVQQDTGEKVKGPNSTNQISGSLQPYKKYYRVGERATRSDRLSRHFRYVTLSYLCDYTKNGLSAATGGTIGTRFKALELIPMIRALGLA